MHAFTFTQIVSGVIAKDVCYSPIATARSTWRHSNQNEQFFFIEDLDIEKTDPSVRIIDTLLLNSLQRSQSSFEHDAFIDSFVSETNVHQFFDFDQSTVGGPPGLLPNFEGSVSLVSQVAHASVLHNMNFTSSNRPVFL